MTDVKQDLSQDRRQRANQPEAWRSHWHRVAAAQDGTRNRCMSNLGGGMCGVDVVD